MKTLFIIFSLLILGACVAPKDNSHGKPLDPSKKEQPK